MPIVQANGLDLMVEEYGSRRNPTLLLVCGWSVQLTFWPKPFIDGLVREGFHVVVFDNRDTGLSQKMRRPATSPVSPHILAARVLKQKWLAAYTLEDMAADAVGVLDALGIERAHIAGLSMGGMIAQIAAAEYPERFETATIMMSSTNRAGLPMPPAGVAYKVFLSRRGRTAAQRVRRASQIWRTIRTQDGGYAEEELEDRLQSTIDRSFYPAGRRRQLEAIVATGDLRRFSRRIDMPSLVIHGSADKLARPHGGLDIAENIPGSRFELIEGMGHDLPPNRIPLIVDMIADHALGVSRKNVQRKAA